MGALADEAGFVIGCDLEGQDFAVRRDAGQFGLKPHLHARRCGRNVRDVHLRADRRAAFFQIGCNALRRRALNAGDHHGGRIDRDQAAADVLCQHIVGDGQFLVSFDAEFHSCPSS